MGNVNVTNGIEDGFVFTPTPSVDIPITVIPVNIGGEVISRTISRPPWPRVNEGPPSNWASADDPWGGAGGTVPGQTAPHNGTGIQTSTSSTTSPPYWLYPFYKTISAATPTTTTVTFPAGCRDTTKAFTFTAPTVTVITVACISYATGVVTSEPTTTAKSSRSYTFFTTISAKTPTTSTITLPTGCPDSTRIFTFLTPTVTIFSLGCVSFVGAADPTTTTTTTSDLPIYATWPPGAIITPVSDPDPKAKNEKECIKIWFIKVGEYQRGGGPWDELSLTRSDMQYH